MSGCPSACWEVESLLVSGFEAGPLLPQRPLVAPCSYEQRNMTQSDRFSSDHTNAAVT